MAQSAFIVVVAEAEPVVAALRTRHDPVAALGVPAHVTLLFPFKAPTDIAAGDIQRVEAEALSHPPFAFSLKNVARFPDTLYLPPEPAAPFVALTRMLVRLFPDHLPYGGAHDGSVPHLTVARGDVDTVEPTLRAALPPTGIAAQCNGFMLIGNASGLWRPLHAFTLGGARNQGPPP